MMLVLQGTQTGFDQSYFIESVTHDYSADRGYTMEIAAKNGSPSDSGTAPSSGDNESTPANPVTFPPDSEWNPDPASNDL